MRKYKRPEKIFAGIGNRDTPEFFAKLITKIGKRLADAEWWWATGASGEADKATMSVSMRGYIYPPWDNFEGFKMQYDIPRKAFDKASEYVNKWSSATPGFKKLHARNMMVISGPYMDPDDIVDLVLCYTRDGCDSKQTRSLATGGTGSALAFAYDCGIPIVNLANKNALELLSIYTGIDFTDIVIPDHEYKTISTPVAYR